MPEPQNNAPAGDQLPPVNQPVKDPAVERLEASLNQTNNTVNRLVNAMQRQPAQNQQTPAAPDKVEMQREFFKNPLDHVAAISQNMSQAITNQAMQQMGPAFETLKEVAKSTIRNEDPDIFDKYELEITAKVAATPPQFHSSVNTWKIAFDAVKGAHLRDILAASKAAEGSNRTPSIRVSDDGGPAAPGTKAPPEPSKEKLTDDERLFAKRLGLSDDQYRSGKTHYNNQNERGKSSWDGQITFDSREKRRLARERANSSNKRPAA